MPLIAPSSYHPPTRLWNGHLQTIIPSLFRKVAVSYVRERISTPDDDFLDLDWAYPANQQPPANSPLVILSHGLEGNSNSQYLAGMVRHLTQHEFTCLAWHYRSCSGELNRQQRFYHIGETGDLQLVIQNVLAKGYQALYLMGFSAGGNVTLKYLGEQGASINPAIKRAAVFSVPLDLLGSAGRLEKWDSLIYNYRFNRALKRKVLQKAERMPDAFPNLAVKRARTIREFDNLFTAPQFGFRDVTDYYTKSSSLQFLRTIAIPTLVVNARNDPFLSPECFPESLARELANVWMEFPDQGGHCGFPTLTNGLTGTFWSEQRALAFLQTDN
jgi:predicted alpha/beta-fold hydrolase